MSEANESFQKSFRGNPYFFVKDVKNERTIAFGEAVKNQANGTYKWFTRPEKAHYKLMCHTVYLFVSTNKKINNHVLHVRRVRVRPQSTL